MFFFSLWRQRDIFGREIIRKTNVQRISIFEFRLKKYFLHIDRASERTHSPNKFGVNSFGSVYLIARAANRAKNQQEIKWTKNACPEIKLFFCEIVRMRVLWLLQSCVFRIQPKKRKKNKSTKTFHRAENQHTHTPFKQN